MLLSHWPDSVGRVVWLPLAASRRGRGALFVMCVPRSMLQRTRFDRLEVDSMIHRAGVDRFKRYLIDRTRLDPLRLHPPKPFARPRLPSASVSASHPLALRVSQHLHCTIPLPSNTHTEASHALCLRIHNQHTDTNTKQMANTTSSTPAAAAAAAAAAPTTPPTPIRSSRRRSCRPDASHPSMASRALSDREDSGGRVRVWWWRRAGGLWIGFLRSLVERHWDLGGEIHE